MKKVILISIAATMAALVVAQSKTEFRANLAGSGKGKAKWKFTTGIGQAQAELSVEGEKYRPGSLVRVFIGPNVWQSTVDALGVFHVQKTYFGLNRPNIGAGTVVTVKNAAGAVLLSGVFQ